MKNLARAFTKLHSQLNGKIRYSFLLEVIQKLIVLFLLGVLKEKKYYHCDLVLGDPEKISLCFSDEGFNLQIIIMDSKHT